MATTPGDFQTIGRNVLMMLAKMLTFTLVGGLAALVGKLAFLMSGSNECVAPILRSLGRVGRWRRDSGARGRTGVYSDRSLPRQADRRNRIVAEDLRPHAATSKYSAAKQPGESRLSRDAKLQRSRGTGEHSVTS